MFPATSPHTQSPPRVDASADLNSLLNAVYQTRQDGPVLVTPETNFHLQQLLYTLAPSHAPLPLSWPPPPPPPRHAPRQEPAASHTPPVLPWPPPLQAAGPLPPHGTRAPPPRIGRTLEHNTRIGPKSPLDALFRYAPGVDVEYPESGVYQPVGHLIPVDPAAEEWPWVDFAYSRGSPEGGTAEHDFFYTPLLVDAQGVPVPCKKRHTTCQGVKACPQGDTDALSGREHWHTSATREDIQRRLAADRLARQRFSSPRRDIFVKTQAYISAVRRIGCRRAPQQDTHRTGPELEQYQREQELNEHFRRGYSAPATCQGRILFHEYPDAAHPGAAPRQYLSCEHWSRRTPDHFVDFTIRNAGYDVDHIAAHFLGHKDELARIEEAAAAQNIGPLAVCDTLLNFSAKTLCCPVDHRLNGHLTRVELCHIPCEVKFRIWVPVNLQACPFVLVTSKGTHQHPVPLPERTPQGARVQIFRLLRTLRQDLADLTARRFLRHPALKTFLMNKFPGVAVPTLTTLHPSLANRAHLGSYIARARLEQFPVGTDWRGIKHLKHLQDTTLPPHLHYIRLVLEIEDNDLDHHDDDDDAPTSEKTTRIIICMAPDSSKRLSRAQYLQSDIGFKRIVGFDEFEIASMDRDANTSVVFCRVYLTRHTAAAHRIIFREINKIVQQDTGRPLYWRHLHGASVDDFRVGLILHWGADQHRGQAKGLGLHLVDRAAELSVDAMDMHEPHRSLRSLTPYEHLRRVYRLCVVHNYRNIQQCAVPEHVRQLMRSLACVQHDNWDGTISKILSDGGKAAFDWVRDKESCQFAFPGICWERSFIPLDVWTAGEPNTNLIETVHRDVNREGVHCTLVGGVLRGQDYDELQRSALMVRDYHADALCFSSSRCRRNTSSTVSNPRTAPSTPSSTRSRTLKDEVSTFPFHLPMPRTSTFPQA
ncbi:hypothetical protein C8R47DRAFT_1052240 [Mycena vitilis]|nr:hypothetical protein C8R47DRAFT_1052240 [Mycena vitilis]